MILSGKPVAAFPDHAVRAQRTRPVNNGNSGERAHDALVRIT